MTTQSSLPIRVRMAPSPTGELHVGSLAIILKNYAFAKKNKGQFILRIEDTDQEREVAGATERIMSTIHAYGLDWDEGPDKNGDYGPYVQSQRLNLYREAALELITKNKAYYCFCSKERLEKVREADIQAKRQPRYDGHCRHLTQEEVNLKLANNESYVIRLKVPHDRDVLFQDLLRGEIITHANLLDDQVLLKSDGFPTYHLAVVVDDHAMKISHIIRGEEWISSTPKHVLLYEAFGWQPPVFAHIPVFLNPDGKGKMSKRKGDVSAQSFLDKGYLPQALLNFLMILGWAPKDQREILSLDEYVNEFALEDLSVKSVAFDINKLNWLNGLYLRQLNTAQLLKLLQPFIPADFSIDRVKQLLPLIHERLVTLADVEPLLAYFFRPIVLTQEQLLIKNGEPTLVAEQLNITHDLLSKIENWQVENLESALRSLVGEYGWKPKQFFMMLRVALTGQTATPPLFDTMVGLSKQTTLERLEEALCLIKR